MPTTLDAILASTRAGLPALRERRVAIEAAAAAAPAPRPFAAGLRGGRVGLIAEVKRRSPSAGEIRADLDPVARAGEYAAGGAAAISVLTEGPHFGGSLDDLAAVSRAVPVPTLRKDFVLDELQLLEARAAGAAAALLIVRALTPARLRELARFADALGLGALVEVHDAAELDVALAAGAAIIGVNSRNLDTFAIDTAAAWALLAGVPPERIAVAESGMASRDDVARAAAAGADAVLIGSALSAPASAGPLLAEITGIPRRGR